MIVDVQHNDSKTVDVILFFDGIAEKSFWDDVFKAIPEYIKGETITKEIKITRTPGECEFRIENLEKVNS